MEEIVKYQTASLSNALVNYSPKGELTKAVRSLPDIWKSGAPSLARMKKETGETKVIALLKLWIVYVNKMLNVSRPMNDLQIVDAAETIMDEFPQLTVADVAFVFNKAKRGEFGTMYEGLDVAKICAWFRQHWDDRLNAGESESLKQHEQFQYESEKERTIRENKARDENTQFIRETIKQQHYANNTEI